MNLDLRLSTTALRRVLALDALSGLAIGVLHLTAGDVLARWLGLPFTVITVMGWAIFLFVALSAWLARQPVPARGPLMLLIVGNLVWAAECLWLAFGSTHPVTPLGQAYLVVQAVAVLGLADLEFLGWRGTGLRTAV